MLKKSPLEPPKYILGIGLGDLFVDRVNEAIVLLDQAGELDALIAGYAEAHCAIEYQSAQWSGLKKAHDRQLALTGQLRRQILWLYVGGGFCAVAATISLGLLAYIYITVRPCL